MSLLEKQPVIATSIKPAAKPSGTSRQILLAIN